MPAKRLLQDQIYRDMKKHTGDYVQAFLDRLEENTTGSRDEESDPEYDEDAMEYDYIDYGALDGFGTLEDDDQGRPDWNTTVGTELHGPTFDPDEDYHKREVRITPLTRSTTFTNSCSLIFSPSPMSGRTKKCPRSYG